MMPRLAIARLARFQSLVLTFSQERALIGAHVGSCCNIRYSALKDSYESSFRS